MNDKRVRRLWRDEGLRVPTRRRKKRLTGIGAHVGAMCPIRPNVLWALDFQFDTTVDGRILKMLNVIDEFTRECVAIEVDRSTGRSTPTTSSPSWTASPSNAAAPPPTCGSTTGQSSSPTPSPTGAGSRAPRACSSTPAPWQNAWVESFNGRFRDELLNLWQFDSLLEARVIIEDWRIDYNWNRPHTAHGALAPAEYAAQWTTINQPKAA